MEAYTTLFIENKTGNIYYVGECQMIKMATKFLVLHNVLGGDFIEVDSNFNKIVRQEETYRVMSFNYFKQNFSKIEVK